MNLQLTYGYDEFRSWAKANRKDHNMSLFTVLKLSLKSKSAHYPRLKAKGHDTLVCVEFLTSKARENLQPRGKPDNYGVKRAAVTTAWNQFFEVVRGADQVFADAELNVVRRISASMFVGWHDLASMSMRQNWASWAIIPKMHLMHTM